MIAAVVYAVGFVIALLLADAPIGWKLALALLWPLGPLAFVVTVAGLTIAAMIAYPLFGAIVAGAAVAGWWMLR